MGGNCSENCCQFSSPTWSLKPCKIWRNGAQSPFSNVFRNFKKAKWATEQYGCISNLVEHVPQVIFRTNPGGHRIAKEDEILQWERSRWGHQGQLKEGQKCVLVGFRTAERTWTTPPGLTPIITQMPLKAESFSSLSLMFRNDVHLWKHEHVNRCERKQQSILLVSPSENYFNQYVSTGLFKKCNPYAGLTRAWWTVATWEPLPVDRHNPDDRLWWLQTNKQQNQRENWK